MSYYDVGIEIKDKNRPIKEVFKDTGLNWTVEQAPIYTDIHPNVENYVVNYRSDTHHILGIVDSKKYKIVNNTEAFNFVDSLDGFTLDRVGMSKNGKQVFVTGKSNNSFEITHDDIVEEYFIFIHGHTGKHGIQLITCPIRLHCTNQLNLALREAQFKYSIQHTGNIQSKLSKIHYAIEGSREYLNKLKYELSLLLYKKITAPVEKYIKDIIEYPDTTSTIIEARYYDTINEIKGIFENKEDNQNYKDCMFGIFNAVADYVSHKKPIRTSNYAEVNYFLDTIQNNPILDKTYKVLKAA